MVLKRFQGQCSNVASLIDLVLSMSPSSAEAERGFSQLKLIKTDIRSKLSQISLNSCLAIRMLSNDIRTFNPLPAIKHWNSSSVRGRRPNFKSSQKGTSTSHLKLNVEIGVQVEECDSVIVENESEVNKESGQSEEVEIDTEVLEEKYVQDDEILESETEDQYEAHERVVMTEKDISDADSDSDEEIDSDLEENNVFSKLFEFARD